MNIPNFFRDVEIFKNLFTDTFVDINDYLLKCKEHDIDNLPVSEKIKVYNEVKKYQFYIHEDDDYQKNELYKFLQYQFNSFGYNSYRYDKYMEIAYLMYFTHKDTKGLLRHLYNLSQILISFRDNTKGMSVYKHPNTKSLCYYQTEWKDIDIMRIFALDKNKKSLKQVCMNLEWYNVQEYKIPPIIEGIDSHLYNKEYSDETWEELSKKIKPWDRYIPMQYVNGVLEYNTNDCLIGCEAIRLQIDEIRLRFSISQKYNIDVTSSSRSNIADKMIEKFYSDGTGLQPKNFTKLRTIRDIISVGECIWDGIEYKTKEFNTMLSYYKDQHICNTKGELEYSFDYNGTTYTLGSGGLHSKDEAAIFIATKKIKLRDADVTSYYPFLIINFDVCPEHLNKIVWNEIMNYIVNERVNAKINKDEITAAVLKIVVNSGGFGKMGFEESFMFDLKAMITVTVNGQLLLLLLCERLEQAGIHVISANTDGIVSQIPIELETKYEEICKQWEKETKFNLEYTEYSKYIRRDVNSYISVTTDGKIKRKGALNYKNHLGDYTRGYNRPIIAYAIEKYFLEDIPVMDTMLDCKDILQFCASQKVGAKYDVYYTEVINGELINTEVDKYTRFYVSNSGGILRKYKREENRYEKLAGGNYITRINLLDDTPIEERNINYGYYCKETMKIIDTIKTGIKEDRKRKKQIGFIGGLFDEQTLL